MRKVRGIVLIIIFSISCSDVEKVYDGKGNLISQGRMVEGQKEGVWVNYYPNRDTSSVETFNKGSLIKKAQYTSDGMSVEENFLNGKKNGSFKVYWLDGSVHIEGFFKNDSLDGTVRNYYPNGVLESEAKYQNGNPYGAYRYYYEDGGLQIQAEDFGNGEHLVYDSLGQLEYTVILKNFVPVDTLFN